MFIFREIKIFRDILSAKKERTDGLDGSRFVFEREREIYREREGERYLKNRYSYILCVCVCVKNGKNLKKYICRLATFDLSFQNCL